MQEIPLIIFINKFYINIFFINSFSLLKPGIWFFLSKTLKRFKILLIQSYLDNEDYWVSVNEYLTSTFKICKFFWKNLMH